MNTIENKHRKYLLGKSEQMFVQCTRYSFIMDLTSCDKSCCYTMNSAAVLWFIKGIVHQKMKFIIIYLLSCCSKTFIVFIFFYLPVEHKGSYLHKNVHAALFYIMKVNDENAIFLSNIFKTILSSDKNKKILYGFWKHQVSYMGYFMVIFKLESTCAPFIFTVCNIKAQPFC